MLKQRLCWLHEEYTIILTWRSSATLTCQPCQHTLIRARTRSNLRSNRAGEPVRGTADLTMMKNGFTALEWTEEPVSEHNLFSIEVTLPADCGYGVVDGTLIREAADG